MCGNPFKRPDVEVPKPTTPPTTPQVETVKVPDPTPTKMPESQTAEVETKKKQRDRRGYAATRLSDDRAVLTDATKRTTLG